MTSVFSWQNCFPLPCFILHSKAKLACNSRYLLTFYFAFLSTMMKRTSFLDASSRSSMQIFTKLVNIFFAISDWGIDLDYYDVEWFALKMNWCHSVIFEIVHKYCILRRRIWQPTPVFFLGESQGLVPDGLWFHCAWWATVHGVAKSWTWLKWINIHCIFGLFCWLWGLLHFF